MLMIFKFFSQVLLTVFTKSLTALSKLVISDRLDILRFLMNMMIVKFTNGGLSLFSFYSSFSFSFCFIFLFFYF